MSEPRKAWIYKITSPTGKIYVGSSVNIKNRLCKYKNLGCKQQTKLYASLCKYGWDAHVFEIIEECTSDNMFAREVHFGLNYNVLSRVGLNLQLPKIDDKYVCMSEESIERKRAFMTGRPMLESTRLKFVGRKASEETRKKLSESHMGHKRSPESIAKGVLARKGYKRPPEYCKWLSESQKGKKMHPNSYAGVAKYRETIKKKVINTKTGEIFNSIADACAAYGKKQGYVAAMLNMTRPNNTPLLFLSIFVSLQKLKCIYNSPRHQLAQINHSFGPLHRVAA